MKIYLFLLLPCLLLADDIQLKNGNIYRNIQITTKESSYIIFLYNDKTKTLNLSDIKEIISKPYLSDKQSVFEDVSIEKAKSEYDPCTDKVLLQLSKKDSLTTEEMRMYIELRKMCEDSKLKKQDAERAESLSDSAETLSTTASIYFVLASLVLGAGLIYTLVK